MAEQAKHTPGLVAKICDSLEENRPEALDEFPIIVDGDDTLVAVMAMRDGLRQAQEFAAAPETKRQRDALLEALKKYVAWHENEETDKGFLFDVHEAASAAIADCEGE